MKKIIFFLFHFPLFIFPLYGYANDKLELALSIKNGDMGKVRELIGKGVDPNFHIDAEIAQSLDREWGQMYIGETPLNLAIKNYQTEIAKLMINHGANSNFKSKDSDPPLFWATFYNDGEIVNLLKQKGAKSLELEDEAIELLIQRKHDELNSFIKKNSLDGNVKVRGCRNLSKNFFPGTPALIVATLLQDVQAMNILGSMGANPNCMGGVMRGMATALNCATDPELFAEFVPSQSINHKVVNTLIDLGANPILNGYQTPLFSLVKKYEQLKASHKDTSGLLELIKSMLIRININDLDEYSKSYIITTFREATDDQLKVILKTAGLAMDFDNIPKGEYNVALYKSLEMKTILFAKKLIEQGASLNSSDIAMLRNKIDDPMVLDILDSLVPKLDHKSKVDLLEYSVRNNDSELFFSLLEEEGKNNFDHFLSKLRIDFLIENLGGNSSSSRTNNQSERAKILHTLTLLKIKKLNSEGIFDFAGNDAEAKLNLNNYNERKRDLLSQRPVVSITSSGTGGEIKAVGDVDQVLPGEHESFTKIKVNTKNSNGFENKFDEIDFFKSSTELFLQARGGSKKRSLRDHEPWTATISAGVENKFTLPGCRDHECSPQIIIWPSHLDTVMVNGQIINEATTFDRGLGPIEVVLKMKTNISQIGVHDPASIQNTSYFTIQGQNKFVDDEINNLAIKEFSPSSRLTGIIKFADLTRKLKSFDKSGLNAKTLMTINRIASEENREKYLSFLLGELTSLSRTIHPNYRNTLEKINKILSSLNNNSSSPMVALDLLQLTIDHPDSKNEIAKIKKDITERGTSENRIKGFIQSLARDYNTRLKSSSMDYKLILDELSHIVRDQKLEDFLKLNSLPTLEQL